MPGFLLISPTGSGKSWACKNIAFYINHAADGDSLINWPSNWNNIDWTMQDRKNLEIVLSHMRETGKCVCWYVGTTAIADALAEDRLRTYEIAIVLPLKDKHRDQVDTRKKPGHDWKCALEHRKLCGSLIMRYDIRQFDSFQSAAEYLQSQL